ncbi:hypothetical protein Fmac_020012 [Flemingia macrophylla]|uniref:Amino acid transporter transmembrane domain-containing protein n=1 Tax=Flemingia macrophylla TaxID=520843 RepID=A0ABD1M9J4_9FABA
MMNSASDNAMYVESEDEMEKDLHEDHNDGNNSFYWNYSNENQSRKSSSYSIAWPQSYKQSIDLYGSVPSPDIGFMGTTSLSRLGSSFISSSLIRMHTQEIVSPERKSLLQHEAHIPGQCSFGQAVLNGINGICGIGILSTPYALKEGGWAGLSILLLYAILCFYTGLLLRHCLDSEPGLETYPDIGQAAFGTIGRVVISIILYMELYACCIEFIIVESDNLSTLFPNAHISLGGIEINSHVLFAMATCIALLPTVWLRDLRFLSYISACGVIATVTVVFCLLWVCSVDNAAIDAKGSRGTTALNLTTLPVAMGIYGYSCAGHALFPNLYSAMANRNQFPAVLFVCFAICTSLYCAVGVTGYAVFGEGTLSQYTLNMPQDLVASKIAVWTTMFFLISTTYALSLSPVALSLEELIPPSNPNFNVYSKLIRTALVASTLVVGLAVPFFGLVMSLIGSFTMFVAMILPAACFLRIRGSRITLFQVALCVTIIIVGVISNVTGSYSSLYEIIEELFG